MNYDQTSMDANLYRRLGACHARVGPFRLDLRCALFTARVRAAGREFRAGFLAPGLNPQSWDVARENRVGRLACIGCDRAATFLNPVLLFFRFSVFESEPPKSKLAVGFLRLGIGPFKKLPIFGPHCALTVGLIPARALPPKAEMAKSGTSVRWASLGLDASQGQPPAEPKKSICGLTHRVTCWQK